MCSFGASCQKGIAMAVFPRQLYVFRQKIERFRDNFLTAEMRFCFTLCQPYAISFGAACQKGLAMTGFPRQLFTEWAINYLFLDTLIMYL